MILKESLIMKDAKYPVRMQFLTTREQKAQFDYLNSKMLVDSSTSLRMILAKFILENEHLLPDELKFKQSESEN